MSETKLYELADLLGCDLRFGKTGIEAKGQLMTDWGLTQVRMVAATFSSWVHPNSGGLAMLIALPRDLGIGVVFEPDSSLVTLFVIDRATLGEKRGDGFFKERDIKTTAEAAWALRSASKAEFVGPTRGPFKKVKRAP